MLPRHRRRAHRRQRGAAGIAVLGLAVLLPLTGGGLHAAVAAEDVGATGDTRAAGDTGATGDGAAVEEPPPEQVAATVTASLEPGPLPADLDPPLEAAKDTLPQLYDDDCFTSFDDTAPAGCVYGERQDPARSVVLFGDSHAAHWFPPLHDVAVDRRWRLEPITKASCPALDLPVERDGVPYDACTAWQANGLERIGQLQPDLVVLSSVRDYAPPGVDGDDTARVAFHADGLTRMVRHLRELVPGVDVVVIGTTPHPVVRVADCLADAGDDDVSACAGDRRDALDTALLAAQREVAVATGAVFVDAAPWMCDAARCPVVVGNRLVHNTGSHLAPGFTRWLRPVFEDALLDARATPPAAFVLPAASLPWR